MKLVFWMDFITVVVTFCPVRAVLTVAIGFAFTLNCTVYRWPWRRYQSSPGRLSRVTALTITVTSRLYYAHHRCRAHSLSRDARTHPLELTESSCFDKQEAMNSIDFYWHVDVQQVHRTLFVGWATDFILLRDNGNKCLFVCESMTAIATKRLDWF